MNLRLNFYSLLKKSLSEEIKWFEGEFDELYLYKKTYNKGEINQATCILDIFKKKMRIIKDKELKISLDQILKKIQKKYPEFFNPQLWLNEV